MSSSQPAVLRRTRRARRLSQFFSLASRYFIDLTQAPWVPKQLRKFLALRMAVTMLLATLVILTVVGLYASTAIKNGIFENRLSQVLQESTDQADAAQTRFDQATVVTIEQVQSLAQDTAASISTGSAGTAPIVLLLRSPQETSEYFINEIATAEVRQSITSQLREAVQTKPGQHWQSTQIPNPDGGEWPAIAVGTLVNLPLAGTHELYLVYSLADEQRTIDLVLSVLTWVSVALLVLVSGMIWLVIRAVLVPLWRTVRTAERLAAGDLDARVLSQGQDETAQLANSFNKMADSLQSKIDTLGRLSQLQRSFVSDVSHELRTPLTTMRMADDVVFESREELNPVARRSAELLHSQIERFDVMLADLLEISRIDSGSAKLDFQVRDLNELAQQVIEDASGLAEKVGCEVIFDSPGHPCAAQLDEARATRIIRNLLVNAIEHSEGNPVVISTDSSETAVALRVSDHGIGMSPTVVSRVFDRFYRADPARARTIGGTGLGLAISLEDARMSGGTLEAWGKEGYGSSFLLTLPRTQDQEMGPSPLAITDYVEPVLSEYAREQESNARGVANPTAAAGEESDA